MTATMADANNPTGFVGRANLLYAGCDRLADELAFDGSSDYQRAHLEQARSCLSNTLGPRWRPCPCPPRYRRGNLRDRCKVLYDEAQTLTDELYDTPQFTPWHALSLTTNHLHNAYLSAETDPELESTP